MGRRGEYELGYIDSPDSGSAAQVEYVDCLSGSGGQGHGEELSRTGKSKHLVEDVQPVLLLLS